MALLPQTSTQGGPNPNSPYPAAGQPMPPLDGAMAAAMAGNARAAAAANARQPQGPPLAAYNPADPMMGATPANGVMGDHSAFINALDAHYGQQSLSDRISNLQTGNSPGWLSDVGNYLFDPVHGPAAQAHAQQVQAGQTLSSPAATNYFNQHPDAVAQAEQDPVGFSMRLGPVLDAAVAAQKGQKTAGLVTFLGSDGQTYTKVDDDTAATKAAADAHSTSLPAANAILNSHKYTDREYLDATQGVSIGSLHNMWAMQHYLNPQQQALAETLNIAQNNARKGAQPMSQAQKEYYNMLKLTSGVAIPLPLPPAQ